MTPLQRLGLPAVALVGQTTGMLGSRRIIARCSSNDQPDWTGLEKQRHPAFLRTMVALQIEVLRADRLQVEQKAEEERVAHANAAFHRMIDAGNQMLSSQAPSRTPEEVEARSKEFVERLIQAYHNK